MGETQGPWKKPRKSLLVWRTILWFQLQLQSLKTVQVAYNLQLVYKQHEIRQRQLGTGWHVRAAGLAFACWPGFELMHT